MAKKNDIRFTVNQTAANYLQWLVENTTLGKTPNEIAKQVLIQRLSEMRGEDFRESASSPAAANNPSTGAKPGTSRQR